MNEWELLEQIQTIKHKLDNNIELTDDEYKLFTSVLFGLALGIMNWSVNLLLNVMKGSE